MKSITKINPLHLILLIAVIELIALPIREFTHSPRIPSTLAGFIIAIITVFVIILFLNNSRLKLQFFLDNKEVLIKKVSYLAPLFYSGLFLSLIFTIQPFIKIENLFIFGFIIATLSSFICIFLYNSLPLKVQINDSTLKRISLSITPVVGIFEALILPFMDYFYHYKAFNPYVNSALAGLLSGLIATVIGAFLLNLILKTKLIKIDLSS